MSSPFPTTEELQSAVTSYFGTMPKGDHFLDRDRFQAGYEAIFEETQAGRDISEAALLRAVQRRPEAYVVLRGMIGLSPPEIVEMVCEQAKEAGDPRPTITQSSARNADATAREGKPVLLNGEGKGSKARDRAVREVLKYLPGLLTTSPPSVPDAFIHRFDKIDTMEGQKSIQRTMGAGVVPYADLLYERTLGRPYATHRDSVSSLVGDVIANDAESFLKAKRIPYEKTSGKKEGYEQAPDFAVPSWDTAEVIIEAKLGEDDGSTKYQIARAKVLRQDADRAAARGERRRLVMAVIGGRGFRVRKQDMENFLHACDGGVYTPSMLDRAVGPGGPLERFVDTESDSAISS